MTKSDFEKSSPQYLTPWFSGWILFSVLAVFFYFGLAEKLARFLYEQDSTSILFPLFQWRDVFSENFYIVDLKLKSIQLYVVLTCLLLWVKFVFFYAAHDSNSSEAEGIIESPIVRCVGSFILILIVLLILVKFFLLLKVILIYTVKLPILDTLKSVWRIEKAFDGTLSFSDLWLPYGDHRSPFPRGLMVIWAKLSHWDLLWVTLTTYFLSLGSFAIFCYELSRIKKIFGTLIYGMLILWSAALITSFAHFYLWVWDEAMIYAMCSFFALLGFSIASNCRFNRFKLVMVCLCGILANYSFSSGLTYWPVAFLLLLWNESISKKDMPRYGSIFSCVAFIAVIFYLHGLPEGNAIFFKKHFLENPMRLIEFIVIFIGAVFSKELAVWVGSIGLFLIISVLRDKSNRARLLKTQFSFFVGLIIYTLMNGLLIAVGRAYGYTITYPLKARLIIWSYPFWISLFVILWGLLKIKTIKDPHKADIKFLLGALITFQMIGFYCVEDYSGMGLKKIKKLKMWSAKYEVRENYVLREKLIENKDLWGSYKYPHVLPVLEKYKLTIFRDG